MRLFFAASIPFLIADGTSFALPTPKPTTPWPSPTTTSALKLRFLPPLTTFVTRLIETTVSLISSCDAAEHRQARASLGALHPLADPVLDAIAAIFLRLHPHYFAPVLPTFFFNTSPM